MKKIDMVYFVHFHDLTGKDKEQLKVDVETAGDLIDHLEKAYPGMGKLLRREDGRPTPNNVAILNRQGKRARFITDFSTEMSDGDSVTLI